MKFLEARDPQREKVSEADCAAKPDVTWPLVRTHPITGRRSLYLNPKNGLRIVTLADGRPAAQELSDALVLNLTRRVLAAGTYRHAWRPGDLVLWDNRVLVHAAVAFDAAAHERLIYRAEFPGEPVYFFGSYAPEVTLIDGVYVVGPYSRRARRSPRRARVRRGVVGGAEIDALERHRAASAASVASAPPDDASSRRAERGAGLGEHRRQLADVLQADRGGRERGGQPRHARPPGDAKRAARRAARGEVGAAAADDDGALGRRARRRDRRAHGARAVARRAQRAARRVAAQQRRRRVGARHRGEEVAPAERAELRVCEVSLTLAKSASRIPAARSCSSARRAGRRASPRAPSRRRTPPRPRPPAPPRPPPNAPPRSACVSIQRLRSSASSVPVRSEPVRLDASRCRFGVLDPAARLQQRRRGAGSPAAFADRLGARAPRRQPGRLVVDERLVAEDDEPRARS